MRRVLVTYSESHGRPMNLVRQVFDDFEVRELEVPAGGLDVTATEALREALQGCEACLLRPGRMTREVFEAADALRVVAVTGSRELVEAIPDAETESGRGVIAFEDEMVDLAHIKRAEDVLERARAFDVLE